MASTSVKKKFRKVMEKIFTLNNMEFFMQWLDVQKQYLKNSFMALWVSNFLVQHMSQVHMIIFVYLIEQYSNLINIFRWKYL